MESFLSRFRNVIVLVIILSAQTVLLATQIKRPKDPLHPETGTTRLIRLWAVEVIVPVERIFSATGGFFGGVWHGYIDLRGVREQNGQLQAQLDRVRLEEVRLSEDAGQARRLQSLLAFKEQYVSRTVAAQVVGTSGTEQSRILYIDKGAHDGVKLDMPVITPTGVVGKIAKVFPNTAQVLEISDPQSGAGVMLEKSRIRGVLRGTSAGYPEILNLMADEKIENGERVLTSGGDQVYPPGLPVGTVARVMNDREGEPFLVVRVKPSADLNTLEEVLVVTQSEEKQQGPEEGPSSLRAADILAQRLPMVRPKPPQPKSPEGAANSGSAPNKSAKHNAKPGAANADVTAHAGKNGAGASAAPGKSSKTGTVQGEAARPKPSGGTPESASATATNDITAEETGKQSKNSGSTEQKNTPVAQDAPR